MSEFSVHRFANEALRPEDQEEYVKDLVAEIQENMGSKDEGAEDKARAGFHKLVKLTFEDTRALAFRACGNEDDALDIVQDTYLRAYKGLPRFRGDAQFSTWLFRITANATSTYLMKRARHRHEDLDDISESAVVYDARLTDQVANRQLSERLVTALRKLPATLRSAAVLHHIYDLPHGDLEESPDVASVASILGIEKGASRVRVVRARKKLLKVLSEDEEQIA